MGNLSSKRDWGHAKDYIKAMYLILQQDEPDDYVIATGKQYSVKKFIMLTAKELKMKIAWKGKGLNEKGYFNGKIIIEIDKKYFRPAEVDTLKGDYKKAKRKLRWKPKTKINQLIKEMINFEIINHDQ